MCYTILALSCKSYFIPSLLSLCFSLLKHFSNTISSYPCPPVSVKKDTPPHRTPQNPRKTKKKSQILRFGDFPLYKDEKKIISVICKPNITAKQYHSPQANITEKPTCQNKSDFLAEKEHCISRTQHRTAAKIRTNPPSPAEIQSDCSEKFHSHHKNDAEYPF